MRGQLAHVRAVALLDGDHFNKLDLVVRQKPVDEAV